MFIVLLFLLLLFAYLDFGLKRPIFVYVSGAILVYIAFMYKPYKTNDIFRYMQHYDGLKNKLLFTQNYETGYNFVEKLFAHANLPWTSFIFFITTVSFIFLIVFFKESVGSLAGFALTYYYARFYLVRNVNQIRSGIASAIVLFSFKYIAEKKPIKFFIIIYLASLFHQAALIALIAYPFYYIFNCIHDKVKIFSITILTSMVLSFIMGPVLRFLNISGTSAYVNDSVYISGSGLKNPVILLQILICVLALFTLDNVDLSTFKYYRVILSTYCLSTILLVLLSQFYTLAGRTSTMLVTGEGIIVLAILITSFGELVGKIGFSVFSIAIFYLINYLQPTINGLHYQMF